LMEPPPKKTKCNSHHARVEESKQEFSNSNISSDGKVRPQEVLQDAKQMQKQVLNSEFAVYQKNTNPRNALLWNIREAESFNFEFELLEEILLGPLENYSTLHGALCCIKIASHREQSKQFILKMIPSISKVATNTLALFTEGKLEPLSEKGAIYMEILRIISKIMLLVTMPVSVRFCTEVLRLQSETTISVIKLRHSITTPSQIFWRAKKSAAKTLRVNLFLVEFEMSEELFDILVHTMRSLPPPIDFPDKLRHHLIGFLSRVPEKVATIMDEFIFNFIFPLIQVREDETELKDIIDTSYRDHLLENLNTFSSQFELANSIDLLIHSVLESPTYIEKEYWQQ